MREDRKKDEKWKRGRVEEEEEEEEGGKVIFYQSAC